MPYDVIVHDFFYRSATQVAQAIMQSKTQNSTVLCKRTYCINFNKLFIVFSLRLTQGSEGKGAVASGLTPNAPKKGSTGL